MIYSSLLYLDFWHGRKQGRDIKCNSMGPEMGLILPNIFRTDQIKLDGNPELDRLTHTLKRGDTEEAAEHLMDQQDQMAWRRGTAPSTWGAGMKQMNGRRTKGRSPRKLTKRKDCKWSNMYAKRTGLTWNAKIEWLCEGTTPSLLRTYCGHCF